MVIKLVLLALLFSGCAHTKQVDCGSPERAAAERGVVLECGYTNENGNRYKSCLVLKASGQTVNLIYRSCSL